VAAVSSALGRKLLRTAATIRATRDHRHTRDTSPRYGHLGGFPVRPRQWRLTSLPGPAQKWLLGVG
jgi:hypothetical protein